jgi:hypothetical protein
LCGRVSFKGVKKDECTSPSKGMPRARKKSEFLAFSGLSLYRLMTIM